VEVVALEEAMETDYAFAVLWLFVDVLADDFFYFLLELLFGLVGAELDE
jgi:hypothetical protein